MKSNYSRRQFLLASSAAGASAAAMGILGCGDDFPTQPRWRGFNTLEMFRPNPDSPPPRGSPVPLPPAFSEATFRLIASWGFNFVRVPMSYWWWSYELDLTRTPSVLQMSEAILDRIDTAIMLGRRYGLHVSLAMHRTPGYCVNKPAEIHSLWSTDEGGDAALAATCDYWRTLASRYRDISSKHLSFDLLNEPPYYSPPYSSSVPPPPSSWYSTMLSAANDARPMRSEDYLRFVTAAVAAIRESSPDRLILAEGIGWATLPDPDLGPLNLGGSFHCYEPFGVAQYGSPAIGGLGTTPPSVSDRWGVPVWPGGINLGGERWDRDDLVHAVKPYADLAARGETAHCGEIGCYNLTPHSVALAWLEDALSIFKDARIGYAMWQLEGGYGLVNSGRTDVAYVTMPDGRLLDKAMLELMQKY